MQNEKINLGDKATVDDVAEHWAEISDMSDAFQRKPGDGLVLNKP